MGKATASWVASSCALLACAVIAVTGAARWQGVRQARLHLGDGGFRDGPLDAAVTIVAFVDFGCGYCVRFDSVLTHLRQKYPEDVSVVTRHLLFHPTPGDLRVAIAAECSRDQDAFMRFKAAAYSGRYSVDDPMSWLHIAQQAGVRDSSRLARCVNEQRYLSRVTRDGLAAQRWSPVGTPLVFVNGMQTGGYLAEPQMDSIVLTELSRQRSIVRRLSPEKAGQP